jgi:hypothetical protein
MSYFEKKDDIILYDLIKTDLIYGGPEVNQ